MNQQKQQRVAEGYQDMLAIHERRKLINKILKKYEKELKKMLEHELNSIFELNDLMKQHNSKDIYETTKRWPSGLKKYK